MMGRIASNLKARRILRRFDARAYPGVKDKISRHDEMFFAEPFHYFAWGNETIKRIDLTLEKLGKKEVDKILDLPCGHGRELRFLTQKFPDAEITACDINRGGVDFCVENFGARGVYSETHPGQIPITDKFDLIWCGSLLSHLDSDEWHKFLRFFTKCLFPGGLLIFTIHGTHMNERFRSGKLDLDVPPGSKSAMLKSLDETGFGFANYRNQKGYGVSLTTAEWVKSELEKHRGLELFEHVERGWFDFQDSVACVRTDFEAG